MSSSLFSSSSSCNIKFFFMLCDQVNVQPSFAGMFIYIIFYSIKKCITIMFLSWMPFIIYFPVRVHILISPSRKLKVSQTRTFKTSVFSFVFLLHFQHVFTQPSTRQFRADWKSKKSKYQFNSNGFQWYSQK